MKIKSLTLCLTALALASCTQTDLIESNASMQGMIDYSLYAGRNTRATTLDNSNFKKFKIYSYRNIETTLNSGTFTHEFYYDETVEKNSSWSGPRQRRWPLGVNDYLDFYAYSDETNTSGYAPASKDTHASFKYAVPTAADGQKDLLVAAAFNQQEKTAQGKLNLDFKHALTQIAFKVKSASTAFKVKVSKVELISVKNAAIFTYNGTSDVVGTWAAEATTGDYAFEVGAPAEIDNVDFVLVESTNGNLMMIPNENPEDVTLRVTYTLNDDDPSKPELVLTKEIKLKAESATSGANQTAISPVTPWAMGKKVTYNLTLPSRANEIIFGDATINEDWATEEKSETEAKDIFGVSSINLDGIGNTAGLPLEINDNRATAGIFSLSSNMPAWVKFSLKPNDYADAKATLADVVPATRAATKTKVYVYFMPNDSETERGATITMTRGDYSTQTIEVKQKPLTNLLSGANSYIVTKSGTYFIDAKVKGNGKQVALPSGATSATAVPASVGELSITGATSASIVWETVNTTTAPAEGSIVKDVLYVDGIITFTTGDVEGNAVVAVKDASGAILWSWHIWRTDTEPAAQELAPITTRSGTFSNGSNKITGLTIMDRNLGALSATPKDDLSAGLFYQWGRKDPFPGTAALVGSTYMAVSGTGTSNETTAISIAASIAKPTAYVAINGDWCSSPNNNFWGTAGVTGKTVTINNGDKDLVYNANIGAKTIYDPCPKGWRVTPSYAFANVQLSETATYDRGLEASILTSGTKTWFPSTGRKLFPIGNIGRPGSVFFWSSASNLSDDATQGEGLTFTSNSAVNMDFFVRSYGFSIRCCKE